MSGRFISLGRAGTPDAAKRYAQIITDHANGTLEVVAKWPTSAWPVFTINELLVQFVAKELPRCSSGKAYAFIAAIRVLRPFFGETPVQDFGPIRYRLMRDVLVAGNAEENRDPWCRATVDRQAKRNCQIFRWGDSLELVPVSVVHNLDTVRSLAIGETAAHDNPARTAVPKDDVEAVRPHLSAIHRDILDLRWLTGARRGELLKLTGDMLEKRDGVWLAELHRHKTARKGKRRILVFNVAAQAILLRHMKPNQTDVIFPVRGDTFGHAVRKACLAAEITPFCPHQLRHSAGAKLVDEAGIKFAQAVLGHSDALMTLHNSRSAEKKAIEGCRSSGNLCSAPVIGFEYCSGRQ